VAAGEHGTTIWRRAGRRADALGSADEVVRRTGWVFNNVTGDAASLEEFVAQGEMEVQRWFGALGLFAPGGHEDDARRTVVEIGSGIGRMTAPLTHRFGAVIAADVDPGFLERCRETVARFGEPTRLTTTLVVDGRSLAVPDASADVVFSYITLQHCSRDVALDLVREAQRVARPGARLALQVRTWSVVDIVVWPAARLARLVWRVAPRLAERSRFVTRLGWQASRLRPRAVLEVLDPGRVRTRRVVQSTARRRLPVPDGVPVEYVADLNRAHWFLVVETAGVDSDAATGEADDAAADPTAGTI
jgi:SAM-dependent methyltransferase